MENVWDGVWPLGFPILYIGRVHLRPDKAILRHDMANLGLWRVNLRPEKAYVRPKAVSRPERLNFRLEKA